MNANWQCPRIDQSSYGAGDPFLQSSLGHSRASAEMQQSMEQQHFLSSATTREQEELMRRKAEHMESLDIAPQHRYPAYTGRSNRLRLVLLLCRQCSDILSDSYIYSDYSGLQTKL